MNRVVSERTVRCRKRHLCQLCLTGIEKGDRARVQTCADGGDIWQHRTHLRCGVMLGAYWKDAGFDPLYLDDDERPDPDEFRAFLAASASD